MNTTITTHGTSTRPSSLTPSFVGLVRAELLKMSRRRSNWIMIGLLLAFIGVLHITVLSSGASIKDFVTHNSEAFFGVLVQTDLGAFRVLGGLFLIVLVAYVIGMEYQLGTIRILLARGVGQIQLLCAKVTSVFLVALALTLIVLLFTFGLLCITLLVGMGNLNALHLLSLTDSWPVLVSVLLSMGVTILMATVVSVLGRSLIVGISLGLMWFPLDNIGSGFIGNFVYGLTHNTFWRDITAYLLGPNVNVMPTAFLGQAKMFSQFGITPIIHVDAGHTVLVTLGYAIVFAATAIILTWKRHDVKA